MHYKKIVKLFYLPILRRGSLKKYLNLVRMNRDLKSKTILANSFPSIAVIDPTNYCNLHCPLCPTGQGRQSSQGYLSFELYEKVLNQLAPYLFEVWLYNWGEPFLNKNAASRDLVGTPNI